MTYKRNSQDQLATARRKLWLYPILGGLAGVAWHAFSASSVVAEVMLGQAGIGLVTGFAIGSVKYGISQRNAGRSARRSRVHHKIQVELNSSEISMVRSELTALRKGLKDYLASKKVESDKIRSSIIDLNNDVARIKERDPREELEPQLKAIADKFGELAGVRNSVRKISRKMARVEGLAQQVAEVEGRLAAKSKAESTVRRGWANWFSKVKGEVDSMWSEVGQQIQHQVETSMKSQVSQRIKAQLSDNNAKTVNLLKRMAKHQESQFNAFESQIGNMSQTIESLNKQILELEAERAEMLAERESKGNVISRKLAKVIQLVPQQRKKVG